jgi:TRAP-type mannitol/chloroaromatic compound transport system permease large subunit
MLIEKMFLAMVKKTMQLHVLLRFVEETTLLTSFDLWMSRGCMDTFALVINYLNESRIPQHFTIALFEVHGSTGFSMVSHLHSLLEKYDLMHHMITIMKNEGSNLMFMATTVPLLIVTF